MNRVKLFVVTISSLFAISCATSSKEIAASYVSPAQYQALNCTQLSAELERLNRRKSILAAELDKKASSDEGMTAISAILFWPAAFALGGNQAQESEYARLKGAYDAVQQASISNNCTQKSADTPKVEIAIKSNSSKSALDYYGEAEEEVINKTYDKNLWAKAFVVAKGKEEERKANYIKLRAEQLHAKNISSTSNVNINDQASSPLPQLNGRYNANISYSFGRVFSKREYIFILTSNGLTVNGVSEVGNITFAGKRSTDQISFEFTSGRFYGDGQWSVKQNGNRLAGKWEEYPSDTTADSGTWDLEKIAN